MRSTFFARGYDLVMGLFERGRVARWRRSTVHPARGLVLEFGSGTGLDFRYYAPGTTVIASEPDVEMLGRARERARHADADIILVAADAHALPFRRGAFDVAVGGLVLCTIPDPEHALHEVRRVLKPGASLRVLEHVRGPHRIVARMQERLTPLWKHIAGGCHLDRDTVAIVGRAGFHLESVTPHAAGYVVEIVGRASADVGGPHVRPPSYSVGGRSMPSLGRSALLALALPLWWHPGGIRLDRAQGPTAREVIDRAESALWGKTLQSQLTMTVTTPRWTRTLELVAWIERPRRSFIRILAPAKEAGIGSLRIGAEMWNYLPAVERTIKIPPSMMLQPWMGSDFTNDDLVKESSLLDDYTHRMAAIDTTGDASVYVVESTPKPDAAVVWGRIVMRVRRPDFLPVREEFYDERGTLIRVMTFSEIRALGGRTIPTKWEMRPIAKPGNVTTIVLRRATYDQAIPSEIFTQRTLEKR